MSRNYTPEQQNVIDFPRNNAPMQNMLVSASAGTGKTTVMIERIARLISQGVNVDQIVVVTFTTLAAAEMKTRLIAKLSQLADSLPVREQLERIDNAYICTLHSFCSDVLRNYFYVVDIDPSFSILDGITAANLKKNAIDELFKEYFSSNDEEFLKLYKIYSTGRKEENFKQLILQLHEFSRNIPYFEKWYQDVRKTHLNKDNNGALMSVLVQDVTLSINHCKAQLQQIAQRCLAEGGTQIAQVCQANLDNLNKINMHDVQSLFNDFCKFDWQRLIPKGRKAYVAMEDVVIEEKIREDFKAVDEVFKKKREVYQKLFNNKTLDVMWQEMAQSVSLSDKLVEMVCKFENKFFTLKKRRGVVDFSDLEHLTLQVLRDDEASTAIKEKYKLVFVDEYQDTNPVQEEIVNALATDNNLFMVGDIKQSIYGFRGCDPTFFATKHRRYLQNDGGVAEQLNDNFRSNKDILDFVNLVFNQIMTEDLGQVDYRKNAQLKGQTERTLKQVPSVRINFLPKNTFEEHINDYYDITKRNEFVNVSAQSRAIADRIKSYVGMAYKDKDGNARRIQYGDIVILMRGMGNRATEIYNELVDHDIPVTAGFKLDGFASKEVREIVNLLRVIDNPYNDIYLVGVCLCGFGNLSETELADVRLNTSGRVPFFDRLCEYVQLYQNETSQKIAYVLQLLDDLRFYSRGASVCEVVLKVIEQTNFDLYVQGLPNGALRLNKLNAFVDSLKGASYAESIDKFLYYIDETDEARTEQALASTNAVRIMTMHASKGLEFPIVILAGMETMFNFDSPNDLHYVLRSTDLGIATQHYDFDKMKRCETIGSFACNLYNKRKQREEEMRLLYVAMTRPKYVLDIFATADQKQLDRMPNQPQNANSNLDWLLYALKNTLPTLQCQSDSLSVEVVDEVLTTTSVRQDLLCEQQTDVAEIMQKLNYAYPFYNQTTMPTKIVSSALDKQFFDDDESVTAPVIVQDDKNKVGTAYHTIYQFVDYNADIQQIQSTITQLVEQGKMDAQYASQLDVELIFQTLQNPTLKQILHSGKVYHEIPFMLYAPYDQLAKDKRFSDDVMLQGVIDLLVIGEGKATVVDFKYTSHSDKVAERYPYQIASYKLAVKDICGIDNVDAYVLSIADNKLIKM